ncbi:MAG: ABC transporter ATP-binding protein [Pseudomonadota bacterium]
MSVGGFLDARNVGHRTPEGDVLLQDATFDLRKGAILAIAGPNGAGKTTLLNILCGTAAPTSGAVRVDGRDLTTMSAAERARLIAVVSQQEHPDARLSVGDYVAMGQIPILADRSAAQHRDALRRILEMTGLAPLATSKMGVLSGGERQRTHIARALAQDPSLLFLDEPTNHLDPDAKGRMLSLVSELGITVVMILHDLVLIPEFATHVALMKATRMTDFGPVSEVLSPGRVRDVFGVSYLRLSHGDRMISALDIRKTTMPNNEREPQ